MPPTYSHHARLHRHRHDARAGQNALRKYEAIDVQADQRVGQLSEAASIAVMGAIIQIR